LQNHRKKGLLALPDITTIEVSKETNSATITMNKHTVLADFPKALGGTASKYRISAIEHDETAEQARIWFETYKPILLIFGYVLLVKLLVQFGNPRFDWMQWMRHFMAGFFFVFPLSNCSICRVLPRVTRCTM